MSREALASLMFSRVVQTSIGGEVIAAVAELVRVRCAKSHESGYWNHLQAAVAEDGRSGDTGRLTPPARQDSFGPIQPRCRYVVRVFGERCGVSPPVHCDSSRWEFCELPGIHQLHIEERQSLQPFIIAVASRKNRRQ